MGYNWEEIFKNKTDKELYDIFIGKHVLNKEAQEFAEKELIARKFNFNNIEKAQKKWKLETLIEEERNERGFNYFALATNAKFFLIMTIFGGVMTLLLILDYFFNFMEKSDGNEDPIQQVLSIGFFILYFIFSLTFYRMKRKQENRRTTKIKQLIKEI